MSVTSGRDTGVTQLCLSAVQGWLDDPMHVSLGSDEPVPPGLQHRYIVVPADRKLAVLCRQIRLDLKE